MFKMSPAARIGSIFFFKLESPVMMAWQVFWAPDACSVHYFDISHYEIPNEFALSHQE